MRSSDQGAIREEQPPSGSTARGVHQFFCGVIFCRVNLCVCGIIFLDHLKKTFCVKTEVALKINYFIGNAYKSSSLKQLFWVIVAYAGLMDLVEWPIGRTGEVALA